MVWTADSNGKVSAARRPVSGAHNVAKLVVGLIRLAGPEEGVEPAFYNNAPAPEKLASIMTPRRLSR